MAACRGGAWPKPAGSTQPMMHLLNLRRRRSPAGVERAANGGGSELVAEVEREYALKSPDRRALRRNNDDTHGQT